MFGSRDEIERLTDERNTFARRCESLYAEVIDLQRQLEIAQAAGRITTDAQRAVQDFYDDSLVIEAAEYHARNRVIDNERARLTSELTDSLVTQRGDTYRVDFQTSEGPRIRDELNTLFAQDGTYDKVEAEQEQQVRAHIRSSLIEEHQAAITAELDTPEVRSRFMAEISNEHASSPELADYRASLRDKLQKDWREEAITTAKLGIQAEEEAREETYKQQAAAEYLESYSGQKFQQTTRAELEKKWGSAAIEEVAAATQDEVLAELLAERVAQQQATLEREVRSRALLDQFRGSTGLDTTTVPEESRLTLYLGTLNQVTTTQERKNQHGYPERVQVEETELSDGRILALGSLGEGSFVVDDDSLSRSDSPYAQNDALPQGTVIQIGRQITDRGTGRLDPRLAAGVPLFFDTDPEEPGIIDAHLPVANIALNGIPAIEMHHIRKL